ncbi:MAG: hypothetical protein GX774_18400 [Armatimonadetes bacterium]|jgi:hypothetical protein|nr:hypothetical protein [Armatimonadota bacterium]
MSSLRWLAGVLSVVIAALGAMPGVAAEEGAEERVTIAILDFKEAGDLAWEFREKAGVICANQLGAALMLSPRYEVVERARIGDVLQQLKLEQSGVVDPDQAAQLGKQLAVKMLIYGEVQRLEIQKGHLAAGLDVLGRIGLGGAGRNTQGAHAIAEVAFKVTDIETGKLQLQKVIKQELDVLTFEDAPAPRLKVATEVLQKSARKLAQILAPELEGKVAAIDPDAGTVVINLGEKHGVTKDRLFRIIERGEEIKDPTTGEVLDQKITEVALARCVEVRERVSTLEVGEFKKQPLGKPKWRLAKGKLAAVKVGQVVEMLDVE